MRKFDLVLPSVNGPSDRRTLSIAADPELWVAKQLEAGGLAGYEPETLACFLATVRSAGEERAVFDVGANIGVFALLAAAMGHPEVVGFEPTPVLAETFRSIAQSNDLNVRVEEIALADEPGKAELFLSTTTDASNSLRSDFRGSRRAISVSLETIDGYCERTGSVPGVLKVDTEATEPEVLRGAEKTLREARPWIVCEVLPGWTERQLAEILEPLDYVWFQITHEVPLVPRRELFGDRSQVFRNWLFAPSQPAEEFWGSLAHWKQAIEETRELSQETPGTGTRERLERSALSFVDADGHVSDRWLPTSSPDSFRLEADEEGRLVVLSEVPASSRVYLSHGDRGFDEPPEDADEWPVRGGFVYDLVVPMDVLSGDPDVRLWVIQYDKQERLTHQSLPLGREPNAIRFTPHPDATSVRLAFRFSGEGAFRLGPLELFHVLG